MAYGLHVFFVARVHEGNMDVKAVCLYISNLKAYFLQMAGKIRPCKVRNKSVSVSVDGSSLSQL